MKTVDFSETIEASDLKGSRSRHLIEFMKVCVVEAPAIKKMVIGGRRVAQIPFIPSARITS